MEHKIVFQNGNVNIADCKVWWDTNPLPRLKDKEEILRDEGDSFSISLVKDGYKSKIGLDTNNFNNDTTIVADLEEITDKEYIFVTPFIHACQNYKMGKPSTEVLWQKVDENKIEIVPNINYIGRGKVKFDVRVLIDSSSKVKEQPTDGVKVYLTNYNHFREFSITLEEAEIYPDILGTVVLTNEEGKTFIVYLVNKLSGPAEYY